MSVVFGKVIFRCVGTEDRLEDPMHHDHDNQMSLPAREVEDLNTAYLRLSRAVETGIDDAVNSMT